MASKQYSIKKEKIHELGISSITKEINSERRKHMWKFTLALLFSIPILISLFCNVQDCFGSYIRSYNQLVIILGAVIILCMSYNLHFSFFLQFRTLRFDMNSLISLGSLTPFLYSIVLFIFKKPFYNLLLSANFVITFFLLGKYLEFRVNKIASVGLRSLAEFKIPKATIINDGQEKRVDVENIKPNTIIIARAGETIPLDGTIIEGESNIDESMITGESMPVFKERSDQVFAATQILDGELKIRVSKIHKETVFNKISEMLTEAQNSKAPIQHMVDKVSVVFVPVVISASFVTFILWFFEYGWNISKAILSAVSVLVVACPCALALATPVAIMVASERAIKEGIIVKDGESLENSSKITTIVFDKTGTLTEGKPKVTDFISFDQDEINILISSNSLARNSNHPLSKAIVSYGESRKITPIKLKDIKEIGGRGIEGFDNNNNKFLRLGNYKFMTENHVLFDENTSELIKSLSFLGNTIVFLAVNGVLKGLFTISDRPKPDAAKAIKELQSMGKEIYIMSGDNKITTTSIAKELGIENVIAEVLPQEKAKYIKAFRCKKKNVAFIGDGLNDALALEVADLGVAIGTGYDTVIESGNMILIQGNPSKVVTAIKISNRTFEVIRQNIFWATIYHFIGMLMAIFGILPPAFAGLAMCLSSLSVVINSLRIKKLSL